MSNRVEELETTVSELESTVRGLTDELVETKERLRTLEEEFDVDAASVAEHSNSPTAENADVDSPVTEVDVNASDKGDKNAETDSENNSSEDENKLGDDIIVA